MLYILLVILCSTFILVLFRLLEGVGADTRHTILVNYIFAAIGGLMFFEISPSLIFEAWFWPAALEGCLFYLVFVAMAKTAQINGVAVAAIATKMSVIIPVSIGLFLLGEAINSFKILGIVAGLMAIIMVSGKSETVDVWKWPIISFFGIGFIDSSFKLFQISLLGESSFPAFITVIFSFAFVAGLIHHIGNRVGSNATSRVTTSSIVFGAAIGSLNFGTVYFSLKALAMPNWESSTVFPILNFGVVLLSTMCAIVFFKERISFRIWTGLAFAIASIGLLYRWG